MEQSWTRAARQMMFNQILLEPQARLLYGVGKRHFNTRALARPEQRYEADRNMVESAAPESTRVIMRGGRLE